MVAYARAAMIDPSARPRLSLSRRDVLVASSAATTAAILGRTLGSGAQAADLPVLRVGTLPFGTAHWLIQTILDDGFAQANAIRVENVPLASNEAARIGFLSGSVDTIVTDLLFAARLRTEGRPIRFYPFSTSEGGLVVKPTSPIKTIADLKGKTIGVAGGSLDKSWLLLRAAAKKQGLDLLTEAHPVFGAPPLLALKVENGELDAGLLYWPYVARLVAKDYREVIKVEEIATQLGAKGKIALVGFVFKDSTGDNILASFTKAVREAEGKLANDPSSWAKIRPLMKAADEKTFLALKDAFQSGIPRKSREDEIAEARSFYSIIATIGGEDLVGKAKTLPEGLYVDQTIYG